MREGGREGEEERWMKERVRWVGVGGGGAEEEGRDRTCVVYAGPASITSCEERAREHTEYQPNPENVQ